MSIPATMRALQQTSLNGPQDLRLITDAPVPVPGPGEVLVRVAAAGVNFGDITQAHGTFLGGPQPPYLAGFEAAFPVNPCDVLIDTNEDSGQDTSDCGCRL